MKFHQVLVAAALAAWQPALLNAAPRQEYLWYRQPAFVQKTDLPWSHMTTDSGAADNVPGKACDDPWESQSLPIGNGRVGGTLFGGDHLERVVLNEVSLWTGGPNLPRNGHGYEYGPTTGKDGFGCYQPFGNLYISFELPGKAENYTRSLNLKDGMARIAFSCQGVEHKREAFVSHGSNVLVYSAKASKPGRISAKIAMLPCHTVSYKGSGGNTLSMRGVLANGEAFEGVMMVRVRGGGTQLKGKPGKLEVGYTKNTKPKTDIPRFSAKDVPYVEVRGADSMEIIISLATDYAMDYKRGWKGASPQKKNAAIMAAVAGKDYATLRKEHIADYKSLYNRLSLKLGDTDESVSSLPTDERLQHYRESGQPDPELEATIYQYGRYMLICGSRPGNLPVNLQGIWNDKTVPPWACDYHNNINVQMCYWGAEVGNLSECHQPFIRFIHAMQAPLHEMTVKEFGSDYPGWTTRISQNPWGGGGWEKWNPPVNAWYALHVWDHYLYTQDKDYLGSVAYPILKNICRFWEKHLKVLGEGGKGLESDGKPLDVSRHPELKDIRKGMLVSPKGWSHEWGPIEDGCMHDQQLIWELFDNTIKAAGILGKDKAWTEKLRGMRDRLVGNRIAKGGYLQEWIVDRPDMVSGHRHTSHLIGVFPGTTISRTKTPELAQAAMKSLELRGLSADNRRSWTWPWRTALWARFGRADKAYDMVQNYVRYNVLDNLFGNHPPMQMDGTFGMTGGISEMLLQSHEGRIELLPTLPPAWADGSVSGIRARGNITVDMKWKNGEVTSCKLRTTTPDPKPVKVIINGKSEMMTPTAE